MAAQAGGEVGELFQKLGGIGGEDFGGGAGRWGAEVGDEVRDGEIDLVSHGTHHRDWRGGNGAGEDFLVEFPFACQCLSNVLSLGKFAFE